MITILLTEFFTINLFAFQYQRSFFPGTSVEANDTIRIKISFFNNHSDTIKGLVYTEQVPENISITDFSVKINSISYDNVMFEQGNSGEISPNHIPTRWIFQTPPAFPESGFLLPGDSAIIEYGLTCTGETAFGFNQDAWYVGLSVNDRLQPLFGFDSLNTITLTFNSPAGEQSPVVLNIPNQIINEGQLFATIPLDNYVADPDNPDNEITWTYSGNTRLSVNINASRVATIIIPNPDWNGSETITFTATDPGGLSDSDPATFTITPINDPPVISDVPNQTITEGQTFTTIALDNYVVDPDNPDNEITWTYSGNTQLLVNINTNRVATIVIPNSNWNGSETIIFTVTDPAGLSASDPATYTVTPVNDPPVVSDIPNQTIVIGDTFIAIPLDFFITDPDNPDNEISWTYNGNNQLTIDINLDHIAKIGISNPSWTGSETITFTATDPRGLSDSDPAIFTVSPISNPPPARVQNVRVTSQ